MGSWTLRPQRSTFRSSNPSAPNRAKRMIRRHGREFHGAGVQEAVRDLTSFSWASQNAQRGIASVLTAFQASAALVLGEAAHGLTAVGWRRTAGTVFCPEHRSCGDVPVTSGDLNSAPLDRFECYECGKDLRP